MHCNLSKVTKKRAQNKIKLFIFVFSCVHDLTKTKNNPFFTCQAIRLYEARHDAFACKQAYSQAYHTVPLCHWHSHVKKEKPCPLGRKTILSTKNNDNQEMDYKDNYNNL